MEPMTVRELLTATGGRLLGEEAVAERTITGVETDSRAVHEGDLFVALRGERTDGHRYIASALETGAAGCLTEEVPQVLLPGKFYIQVEDTMLAIGQVARAYREKFPLPVIGITGSVGKTTTKDMVASVLGQKFRVLKTEGNFNNELGLPLTLFRLTAQHQICVLEMGMNHFGEIDYLTQIAPPDVAVITHIENLGSRAGILQAKKEIFHRMTPEGMAVLNGDDAMLRPLEGELSPQVVFCGADRPAPYAAKEIRQLGSKGLRCRVITPKNDFSVTVPALGGHMIYPVLMACAIGERFGMTGEEMKAGIEAFVPTKMRMNVIHQGDITILDDAYNANPQSMRAAISVLSDRRSQWSIAVLGDMFELGPFAPALHTGVGECLGKARIDCLVAVGELAEHIAQGARNSGVPLVYHCKDKAEAKPVLDQLVRPGSTILVKASRGMELEELTAYLLSITPEAE